VCGSQDALALHAMAGLEAEAMSGEPVADELERELIFAGVLGSSTCRVKKPERLAKARAAGIGRS